MRTISRTLLSVGILSGIAILPLPADYLKNSDLKEGMSGWHGDGEAAFLKADGTEGSDSDQDAIPVIKLTLKSESPRVVYQEFETRDKPATLHFKVDFFASSDFQRSKSPHDYTPQLIDYTSGYFQWNIVGICNADFWLRIGPDWHYKLAQAVAGKWITVDYKFTNTQDSEDRSVYFCVPPGQGMIYLKNPLVEP